MAEPEVSVTLRFSDDDLDPDAISAALGIEPHRATRKGASFPRPSDAERTATSGLWMHKIDRSDPGDLDEKVSALFAKANPDLEAWQKLRAKHPGDLFCGVFLTAWNVGIVLRPSTMLAIAQRGLDLDLDIYAQTGDYEK